MSVGAVTNLVSIKNAANQELIRGDSCTGTGTYTKMLELDIPTTTSPVTISLTGLGFSNVAGSLPQIYFYNPSTTGIVTITATGLALSLGPLDNELVQNVSLSTSLSLTASAGTIVVYLLLLGN